MAETPAPPEELPPLDITPLVWQRLQVIAPDALGRAYAEVQLELAANREKQQLEEIERLKAELAEARSVAAPAPTHVCGDPDCENVVGDPLELFCPDHRPDASPPADEPLGESAATDTDNGG